MLLRMYRAQISVLSEDAYSDLCHSWQPITGKNHLGVVIIYGGGGTI